MTNQNKAKTRDELRDELAFKHWQHNTHGTYTAFQMGFDAATEYHNANPSPGQEAVQGLLDALDYYAEAPVVDLDPIYAQRALETYRKVTSKE